MAKKNPTGDAAETPVNESQDLSIIGDIQGTLDRPKTLDKDDLSGTEGIGADDVRLPRLAIAQGLSPQMVPGNTQFIEGLGMFDMFNDLTSEIYGKGPMKFVPVRRDVRRIEFVPRDEGGGVRDMDVPKGDPRTKWTVVEGERIPPTATEFVEFVVLLLRPGKQPEPVVLSIKTTNKFNRRAADQLTTFIKLRQAPIYAGIYTVASGVGQNDNGTFGVPVAKNAGFIPKDTPAGKALYDHCEKFHRDLVGKNIVVNRDGGADADEFDVEAMERAGTNAAIDPGM